MRSNLNACQRCRLRLAFVGVLLPVTMPSIARAQALVSAGPAELLSSGYGWAEGPAYDGEGGLWFTDLRSADQNPLPKRIYRHDIASGETVVVVDDSGGANGLLFDRDGRFLSADGSSHRLVERNRDDPTMFNVLADNWQGVSFNGPNDLVQDAAGGIYFTDPNYVSSNQPEAVYYLDPAGDLSQVASGTTQPNGIGLSPDESTLYVVAEGERRLYAFDVEGPGALANRRSFQENVWGDGMTVDRWGNVYVANFNVLGVDVISPAGRRIESIPIGEPAINVELVGDDQEQLYITAQSSLYRAELTYLPAGDYNGNGMVEQADLDLVLLHWGQPGRGGFLRDAGWINDLPSRLIDQEELDKVLLGWGSTVESLAAASVPEPATIAVLLIAVLACRAYDGAHRHATVAVFRSTP